MLLRYSFIPVFACLLCGLAWWSKQVESSYSQNNNISVRKESPSVKAHRRELVEALDRVIAYQHYYHSVYGHFSKLLNKIGFVIPSSITDVYDIRVSEASQDRVIVTAFSEENGKILDLASIDQDFQIHSNFSLPAPRSSYLKLQAMKHLRLVKESPDGQLLAEQGVYKGYFQYTVKGDSKNGKSAFAVGVRPPVTGVQLELNDTNSTHQDFVFDGHDLDHLTENESSDYASAQVGHKATGQKAMGNVSNLEEETLLAQKIFRGEMGRYAKTWSELSKIANFKFEGKEQHNGEEDISNGSFQVEAEPEVEHPPKSQDSVDRKISSIDAPSSSLEFEEVTEENK